MVPFAYSAAPNVETARRLAAGRGAMFIAGGTDLLQLLQDSVIAPRELIDINSLPFAGIEVGDGARIGALTRIADVADDAHIRRNWPLLTQALQETASPQVRNMATVGGNLLQRTRCLYFRDATVPCNKRQPGTGCPAMNGLNRIDAIFGTSEHCIAAYPGDMAVALTALDAELVVQGRNSQRQMRVADLFRLPGNTPHIETTLQSGDIISAILLPPSRFNRHSHYLKVRDRASFEWALVSVAAALEMDGTTISQLRIVAGGVGTKPWRLEHAEKRLTGRTLDPASAREAGDAATKGATPRPGNAFKVPLLQRAVERCLLIAGGMA
jgi:xanthine dehydrogenase YagS FAD-binding subunit